MLDNEIQKDNKKVRNTILLSFKYLYPIYFITTCYS